MAQSELKRGLNSRHMQFMAIGGAIGTGLFMGSAKTIDVAGSSVLFVYASVGVVMFFAMRVLGELLLSNLKYKSLIDINYDILGKFFGYLVGWSYWLELVLIGMADMAAAIFYMNYWFPNLNHLIPAIGIIVAVFLLNAIAVKAFGEMEFWLSLIKVATIVIFVAIGFGLLVFNAHIGLGDASAADSTVSFSNLGSRFLPNGTLGFLAGYQIAFFSFGGIEMMLQSSTEVKDPEKNIPKAINSLPLRVCLFYVLSLFIALVVIPKTVLVNNLSGGIRQSIFVLAFSTIGIPFAAGIVNFVVLSATLSSCNSVVWATSRLIYGLGSINFAPKWLIKLSKTKVPFRSLMLSVAIILAGGLPIIITSKGSMDAFDTSSGVACLIIVFVWIFAVISYIAYCIKYPKKHKESKFKVPGGIVTGIIMLIFFIITFIVVLVLSTKLISIIYLLAFFAIAICSYYITNFFKN